MNSEQTNYGPGGFEQPQAPVPAPRRPGSRKSASLATILSLMPGLGQIYTGYYQQGFINMAIASVTITILNSNAGSMEPLFGVFLAFFWMYNMIDANRRAHHCNRVADGLGGEVVPDEFNMPGARGSVPAGVVLIVIGALLLLELNTDISMDWLENWWPVLLVVGGGWMILKSRKSGG
ncbi:MAG TPA: DUF5668 domain-containing protein [Candidatus Krumholzibacteria bacterium]|nr:DUF5668 domain-containing protein [Candidatus Krumholzibacteria bacterium]